MQCPVRAITLDLDDTIWPIAPAIARAERALESWMTQHAPTTAARWPLAARQRLRQAVDSQRPDLAHDMSAQRRHMIEQMLADGGDDPALAAPAYEAYFAARCQVEPYPGSVEALRRLGARVPLVALSNGNACLRRIGLMHLFRFQLGAAEHGAAKPAASFFHAACTRLDCAPAEVLHVGDDSQRDVHGARRAGLRSCWINRPDSAGDRPRWPHPQVRPDHEFADLAGLADWLDATRSPHPRLEETLSA